MDGHQRFVDIRSFLLQGRNYSIIRNDVVQFCEAFAAHIFRLEYILYFHNGYQSFGNTFQFLLQGRWNSAPQNVFIFAEAPAAPTFRSILYCSTFLQCLMWIVLVKKLSTFYGTRRFLTALRSARHVSLSWASPIQSSHLHPTSWRSILTFLALHSIQNPLLLQGLEKQILYGQCGSNYLSPDSVQSYFCLFGPLKDNLREHFWLKLKQCRMLLPCNCRGSYKFTGRKCAEFFKSVRRQLTNVLTTLKNNMPSSALRHRYEKLSHV
jgi:hypothetical protein